jgi:hypothetical protein
MRPSPHNAKYHPDLTRRLRPLQELQRVARSVIHRPARCGHRRPVLRHLRTNVLALTPIGEGQPSPVVARRGARLSRGLDPRTASVRSSLSSWRRDTTSSERSSPSCGTRTLSPDEHRLARGCGRPSERYLRAGLFDKMPHCAHVNANRKRKHAPTILAGDGDSPGDRSLDGSKEGGELLPIHRPYGNLDDQGE